MITAYKAKSAIEAKILQDILSMEGINSHIMGAYLEGGIGEIQTYDIVKLAVDEADYKQARVIIKEWENRDIEDEMQGDADYLNSETTDLPLDQHDKDNSEGHSNKSSFWTVPIAITALVVIYVVLVSYWPGH